jgi:acyl-CoA synthetase (NDP forming)
MVADPTVDVLLVGITAPQSGMGDTLAADVCDLAAVSPKPVVVTWNSWKTDERGFDMLVERGLPMFRSFRNCFAALAAFRRYELAASSFRRRAPMRPGLSPELRRLFDVPGPLDGEATRSLLQAYGIPMPASVLVGSAAGAAQAGTAIGFPVVMKLLSRDVPHKSDAGLVRLGVRTAAAAALAHDQMAATASALDPPARVEGVVVQDQVEDGIEILVGVTQDPVFGPAITLGSGGIFAEVLRDIAVRPLPLDRADVEAMFAGLRIAPLLAGARGRPPADVAALVDTVLAVASLAAACGPHLAELDLNPLVVRPDGVFAVDALVVAAPTPPGRG